MTPKHLTTILMLILFSININAQAEIIYFENPSYEDVPRTSTIAKDWHACNFVGQSPPDIQPGHFNVYKKAYDGNTYAGLVSRENGTFEVLMTELKSEMIKGQCYEWVIYLAQSNNYLSLSKVSKVEENFNHPVDITINGAMEYDCINMHPLATIKGIKQQNDWTKYRFKFVAKEAYKYLIITVSPSDLTNPTNGHILLDHFHPIIPIECGSQKITAKINKEEGLLEPLNSLNTLEEKIKYLIDQLNFDDLYEKPYWDYQLYLDKSGNYKYENIYWKKLVEISFSLDKKKLYFIFNDENFQGSRSDRAMKYLKKTSSLNKRRNKNLIMKQSSDYLKKKPFKESKILKKGKIIVAIK